MWEENKGYKDYEVFRVYKDKVYKDYKYYVDYLVNNWSDFDTKESESDRKARIKAEERERKINIILGE